MSGKGNEPKSKSVSKKKQKNKRQASSPLDDNSQLCVNNSDGNNTSERKTGQKKKKCKRETKPVTVSDPVSVYPSNINFLYDPNMTFQQQTPSFGMPQPQTYMQSPPPQPSPMGFGYQPPTAPPPWAAKLIEDIEQIKQKFDKIDKIEKTVNLINSKVSDLESKMQGLETRLSENEKSCQFISNENDKNKSEIKSNKDELKVMKKRCDEVEKHANTLKASNMKLESKVIDLESRSMRENLMFYGIAEGGDDENCENLVKDVCRETLKVTTANQLVFDRAHRVGRKSGGKVRPIVVKFHYYHERELIRKRSYDYAEALKNVNLGVGAQLPKDIRDARKLLYPAMKKAKDEGKDVKFVGKKLYINGAEHTGTVDGAGAQAGPDPMVH